MIERLATLKSLIEITQQQLYRIAGDGRKPLASGAVLEKSKELDSLINDYIKLRSYNVDSVNEGAIDMLHVSKNYDQANQNKVTIFLNGSLDISTVSILNDEISKITEAKEVVIDFTELSFIDSTGIGALLDIIYNSRHTETVVEFYGINEYIMEIFETVGIIRVLEAVQRKC